MIVKSPRTHADENPSVTALAGVTPAPAGAGSTSLLNVLWGRRWTVLVTVLVCLVAAGTYLIVATPVYTSTSSVYIEQAVPKILTDAQGALAKSDSFLFTQAEIIKSAPILSAALEGVDYRSMKTFAGVDNPIAWLQADKEFHVAVGKKDDVVTVALDSPHPQEAAEVVNSIVDAYMTAMGKRKRTTAGEMLKVLQKEKEKRDAELAERVQAMLDFKRENGAISFHTDKGNIILERLAKLSDALTAMELETLQLQAEYETAESMLSDPQRTREYVQDLQIKAASGDKEYDELRAELVKYRITLSTFKQSHGANSQTITILRGNIANLEETLTMKERAVAEARVAHCAAQLKAAKDSEGRVRAAFTAQQEAALELNSKAAEYARLEDEKNRLEKSSDLLDTRIKEVSVNSEDTGALNIQVLEVARAEDKPSKPRKALTLAAALLVGLMLGTALALVRDWVDHRIRTVDEVTNQLGIPLLGVVPEILHIKTQHGRGQHVHQETMSEAAEAYRTVRTAIHFGSPDDLKTILVTSPAPGDGKSTTASNLAITMSQAGHRTLLLDADFRKPTQHKIHEMENSVGMCSVVTGRSALRDAIRPTAVPRLDLLSCGPIPPNPSEIIAGKRFAQVMAALTDAYDRVVVDSPPVMAVTDGRILAASADVTVLVLRTNRSTRKASRLAFEALQTVGAQVLGAIVNAMPQAKGTYGYGSYGAYISDRPADAKAHAAAADDAHLQLPADALALPRAAADDDHRPLARVA